MLQAVVNSDFKPHEIEVGLATVDQPRFRTLKVEEVEAVLSEMNDAL